MKKLFVSALLAVLALGFAGGMIVNAQTTNPPATPVAPLGMGGMMRGANGEGLGIMHDVLVAKLAEKTGLAVADIEAKLDAGTTLYVIANEAGLTAEDVQTLMLAARDEALTAAVSAGTITQQQADWMKSRMFGQGRGGQMGMRGGNCFGTGTATPMGMGFGKGGRWAKGVTPTP